MFEGPVVDGKRGVRNLCFGLCFGLCFVGCASTPHEALSVSAPRPLPVDSTIGAGDVFDVRVFQEPDLTGTHRVGPDGTIDFPLVGKVDVSGKSTGQVAALLRDRLKAFLQNPQVSILLKEANSKRVIIYGQVQHPGTFPYGGQMTISQAISLAGGFTAMAARERVRIQRASGDHQEIVQVDLIAIAEGRAPNQFVAPGDEVFVPERVF